jgi:hypothetical protein
MPYQATLSSVFEKCSIDVAVAKAEQTAAKAFVDDVIPTHGAQ